MSRLYAASTILLTVVAFALGRENAMSPVHASNSQAAHYARLVTTATIRAGRCQAGEGGNCLVAKVRMPQRPVSVDLSAGNGGAWEYSAAGSGLDIYHQVFAIYNLRLYTIWNAGWLFVSRQANNMTVPVTLSIDILYPV